MGETAAGTEEGSSPAAHARIPQADGDAQKEDGRGHMGTNHAHPDPCSARPVSCPFAPSPQGRSVPVQGGDPGFPEEVANLPKATWAEARAAFKAGGLLRLYLTRTCLSTVQSLRPLAGWPRPDLLPFLEPPCSAPFGPQR